MKLSGTMPDITLVQLTAAIGWVAAQAVLIGLIDNNQEQLLVMIGSTVVAAAWKIADAIIRQGRAKAVAAKAVPPTVT
jgi:hypothetical protein